MLKYALSAIYANLINLIHASKQSACKQTHRKFVAITRGTCCNLKMLSRRYLIHLTKTFGSIKKLFGRVKKTIPAKTLVDWSKRVSLTEQKFGRLNQNFLWNQPNTVNQTILLDEPFLFSECDRNSSNYFLYYFSTFLKFLSFLLTRVLFILTHLLWSLE